MPSDYIYNIIISKVHKNTKDHDVTRYIKFILSCLNQKVNTHEGYETHHICPKSIFPEFGNLSEHAWNSARLTCRQHLIAHWMLARIFGGTMVLALWYMANEAKRPYEKGVKFVVYSRLYAEARRLFVSEQSKRTKALWNCDVYRENMTNMRTELWNDDEIRETSIQRMKDAWTPERKQAQAIRSKEHMFNMNLVPEFKKKQSESGHTAVKLLNSDPEILAKKKIASSKTLHGLNKKRKVCEFCNKPFSLGMYSRWHGPNCKLASV